MISVLVADLHNMLEGLNNVNNVNLTDELKNQIDSYDYLQLLASWRHAPVGDPRFQGDAGDYYRKRMQYMRLQEQLIEDYGENARPLIVDALVWFHERDLLAWQLRMFDHARAVRELLREAGFVRRIDAADIHVRASRVCST